MKYLVFTLLLVLLGFSLPAQTPGGRVGEDRAGAWIEAGQAAIKKRDFVSASKHFEQARALLEQNNDPVRLGRLLVQMGDVNATRSYFRIAVDNYRDALNYLRSTGQTELIGICWENLASINFKFGRSSNALEHYERALSIKTRLNDAPGMAKCHLMLSKLYFDRKQYEQALLHNREAKKLLPSDWTVETETTLQEAVILTFLGRYPAAEQALHKAQRLVNQQNIPTNRVKLLSARYNFHLSQKDLNTANQYLDSALVMLRGSQNPELAIIALEQIAEINKNNGDYKAAYEAMVSLERYKEVFRSENMERISVEISEAAEEALTEKEIVALNLSNRLKEIQLSKEKQARRALLRENLLQDSAYTTQAQLLVALEKQNQLRNAQLQKEQELRRSLSRENNLKQRLLNDERQSRNLLFAGLTGMFMLGGMIYLLYRRQHKNNQIIGKQKEELAVLNREIHHRVKNNLQVISSMLDLQSSSLQDATAKSVIKEAILRVQAMAFIHQNLYQDEAVNSVNMTEYIQLLSDHLFKTYNIKPDKIQFHTQIEPVKLHTDTAIPLGMVLNELISNALKYAFRNQDTGNIWVTLRRNHQELLLQVKDDGLGLPADFSLEQTNSFGYEIIQAMAQKLRARLNISGMQGTDVQLLISKFKTTA